MATRRYSNAGSFGEGLTQGFGLINNVYENRRKNELAEQELQIERDYRQGMLDDRAEGRRLTDRQLDIMQKGEDNDLLRLQNERLRLTAADKNADSAATYRNAQAREIDTRNQYAIDDRNRRITGEERRQQMTNDFLAAQDVIDYYNAGQRDRASYDPKVMAELMKKVGGMAAFSQHINPITVGNYEAFQEALRDLEAGVEPDQAVLRDMAATVFAKNRDLYGIGDTVSAEQNPAAPEWSVGMEIINKIPSSVKGNQDGTFSFGVDVQVRDPKTGRIFIYEAPMTEGADGSGVSPTVTITAEELFQASGGFIQYSRALQPMKAAIQEAQIKSDSQFQNKFSEFDANKYESWLNESKLQFQRDAKGREEQESLIKGVTNQQLLDNPELLKDYHLSKKYDPDSFLRTTATSPGDKMVDRLMELPDLDAVRKQMDGKLPPLTRSQILELQDFVDQDAKGNLKVSDRKKFNAWRDKVTKRLNPTVSGGQMNRRLRADSRVAAFQSSIGGLGQ